MVRLTNLIIYLPEIYSPGVMNRGFVIAKKLPGNNSWEPKKVIFLLL